MIKVVDAIMGSGKSSAAISYINDHPNRKFVYITPYLEEVQRICQKCTNVHMYEPIKTRRHHGSKTLHTLEMIKKGYSIATTHQAFLYYTPELLDEIRRQEYMLIMDESVNTLVVNEGNTDDINIAVDAGLVTVNENDEYEYSGREYNGTNYREMIRCLQSRNMMRLQTKNGETTYFWAIPKELITSFRDVVIMTYLFEGQNLYHFLCMYNLSYEPLYVTKDIDGRFVFSETERYIPDYVKRLSDMIHITEKPSLNEIGDEPTALSERWFSRNTQRAKRLKDNIYNFYRYTCGSESAFRMWGTYSDNISSLSGKGYTKSHVMFNERASNKYKERTALAYCVNLYMNVGVKMLFKKYGIEVDDDMYALSTMIQWIWRSAIRDGHEIWLYVPSKRMRTLLKEWIIDTEKNYT